MRVFGYALFSDAAYYAAKDHEWVGFLKGPTLFNVCKTTKKLKKFTNINKLPKADVLVTSAVNTDEEQVFDIASRIGAEFIIWDLGERGAKNTRLKETNSIILLQAMDWNVVILEGVSAHRLGLNFVENRTFLLASKHEYELLVSKHDRTYPYKPLTSILNTQKDEDIQPVMCQETFRLHHKSVSPQGALNRTISQFHLGIQHKLNPRFFPNPWLIGTKVHRLTPKEVATLFGAPFRYRKTILNTFLGSKLSIFLMFKDPCVAVWGDMMERWLWKGTL